MSINNTLCKNQIDENWNNMKCYKNAVTFFIKYIEIWK